MPPTPRRRRSALLLGLGAVLPLAGLAGAACLHLGLRGGLPDASACLLALALAGLAVLGRPRRRQPDAAAPPLSFGEGVR